jgi:hypothetical protein
MKLVAANEGAAMKTARLETVLNVYLTTDYELAKKIIAFINDSFHCECHMLCEANKPYAVTIATKFNEAMNALGLIQEAIEIVTKN